MDRRVKHGMRNTRLYQTWKDLNKRCYNPNHPKYHLYRNRANPEWREFIPFAAWALDNGYEDHLTIDRIDNEKGYSPENCRFISRKQNSKNRQF